jgi:magnesium transporter
MPERTRIRDLATSDYYAVSADETVAEAVERIRKAPHIAVSYLYAVDAAGRLAGVVPLRKLLTAPPGTRIREVLAPNVIALPADGDPALLQDFFATYRFLAFPVVDAGHRLVGVVQADAFNEALVGEFEGRVRHDWLASAGVTEEEKRATPLRILRLRLPWLLVTLASGLLSAIIAGRFQWALERLVIVSFFVPVVLLLSESVGMQTSAVVLSAMGEDIPPKFRSLLLREMGGAGMLGLTCGCLIGGVSYSWLRQGGFSFVLTLTLTLTVTTASALAVGVPGLFRRLGIDPSLAAAPLTLAVTDNLTLLAYLLIASRLLT